MKPGKDRKNGFVKTDRPKSVKRRVKLRQEEDFYRNLVESTSDSLYLVDRNCKYLFINQPHLLRLGLTKEEAIGRSYDEFHSAAEGREFAERVKKVIAMAESVQHEYRSERDGRYFLQTYSPVSEPGPDGRIMGVAIVSKEITERKQAEEAKRESEERYRTLVENASDIVFRTDNVGHFTFVNPAVLRITGYKEDEILGIHYPTLIRPDRREEAMKFFGRQFVKGIKNTYTEYPILTKEGHEVWLGQNTQLIVEDGHVIGFQAVSRDITQRKRAEEALRERELFFSGTLNDMLTFVAVLEPGGDIIFVNNTPLKIAGMNLEDIIGEKFYDTYWWEYSDEAKQTIREDIELASSGKIISHPIQVKTTEGLVWIEFSIHPIYDDKRKVKYIVPEGRDITNRKQAEEALRESEELYKTLAEKSMAGVYVVQDGNFRFINSNAASYAGYTREELLDQEAGLLVSPEDREKVRQNAKAMLLGEMSSPYEFRIITKQGETRWIMETVTSILHKGRPAILGNSMDITSHKKMEAEIRDLSITDPLTGLYNRRGFLTLAEQQLNISKRTKVGLLLLFADLDGMKWINDNLGHKKGDEALIEVANVFNKVFRDADIVARVGGDEFSVLAVGIEMEDSRSIEDRLQYQIGINNSRENRDYPLSLSVGIAYNDPENPSTIDELMSHADVLMYKQKKGKLS